jgi:polyribonucleotide nucleotidyltransferase
VDDVVKVGDKVQVQIAEVDSRGKLSLIPVEAGDNGAESGAGDAPDEA